MNFQKNWSSRFWRNRFLGFDSYAPCVKKFAIHNINGRHEKRISTELYTSDSDSSTLACSESSRVQQRYTCAMIERSWVTRKVVCVHVVAVFQIVHELWVVSHESFTCFTTSAFTLYTYYIELSTGGHTVFHSFALQMSIPPQLSLPQYISNLYSSRQKTIWNIWTIGIQLQYNICIYNTIQYNIWTIWNTATGCLYLSWT